MPSSWKKTLKILKSVIWLLVSKALTERRQAIPVKGGIEIGDWESG